MKKSETDNSENSRVILFDGVCNLCNGLVMYVLKNEKTGRIKFASLQSDTGQKLVKNVNESGEINNSVIYLRDGKIYMKSSASLYILKDVGGIWGLTSVLFLVPRPIRDYFYNLVSRHRYKWFGKREICMVPTPEMMMRFL